MFARRPRWWWSLGALIGATCSLPVAAGAASAPTPPAELTQLVARYPQDYALVLELAWAEFQAGRYAEAERHYRTASALSLGSRDARLGLGWTLAYLGRCDEARVELEAAQALDPSDSRAREGLEACAPGGWLAPATAVSWFPSGAVTGHLYTGSPDRDLGFGIAAGLSALVLERGLVGALYRFTDLPVRVSGGQGGGGRRTQLVQHELWMGVGFTTPLVGAVAQYAPVFDRTGFSGTSHHLGGSARLSLGWDVFAEGGVSLYDPALLPEAQLVGSTGLGVRMPLPGGVFVHPGGRVGFVGGEVYGAVSAALGIEGAAGRAYAGGTLGRERLPVHWSVPVVYDLPETLAEGLVAGVALELGDRLNLSVDYQLRRLVDADAGLEGGMHLVTIGLFRSL